MKSSVSLAKTDKEQTNPNKDNKSGSAADQTTIKQEPVTQPIKQDSVSSTTNATIPPNTISANLVPINLSPTNTILIPQQQQFQVTNTSPVNLTNNGQTQIINPSNLVPVTTIPLKQPVQQLIAIPAANPTLPNKASALQALQQSLKGLPNPNPLKLPLPPTAVKQENTNSNTNSNSNSNEITLKSRQNPPPAFPIPQQQTVLFYPQRPQIMNPPYDINRNGPLTIKDEKLNENWSAKIAYAATLSSIINETSKLYREKAEISLKPNWAELLYHFTDSKNENSDNKNAKNSKAENENKNKNEKDNSRRQQVYDVAIDHIFKESETFLKEISATMHETKITEAIGMLKGLTDAVCALINNAGIHLPGCDPAKMRNLFENKLLVLWCSLLLRATTDVREAMQRYLCHEAFNPYFHYKHALNNEFYKHLSSDEKLLVSLRSQKEQADFEANTRKYVEEANLSLMAVRRITVLPTQDRMNTMNRKRDIHGMFHDDEIEYQHLNKRSLPKPPKKRRKKSRYQLFRVDGTPRKRQQNPCDRRICKRMWQSDGVTRGCGQNSHPRGVCPCWKTLGFTKEDEKNGNILKWLEDRYGKQYKL